MTELVNISLPFDTDILSTITSTISTNLFTSDIATVVDVDVTTIAAASGASMPVWVGFIGCLVASLFFGSNFVPVKQFSAGDGVFFQFVYCVAVYIVGLIVDLILNNQRVYPLVLIGGQIEFR